MKTIHAFGLSLGLALLVAMGVGMAEEPQTENHSVYAFRFDDGTGGDFEVRLDSDELGFDVFDLSEGDSYDFTTEDGRPVTISNVDGELWLDVDGQLIELKRPHRMGMHAMKMHALHTTDGITITSGKALDEDTKARIVQALQDAGVDQEVSFSDEMEFNWVDLDLHGEYEVRIEAGGDKAHRKAIVIRDH